MTARRDSSNASRPAPAPAGRCRAGGGAALRFLASRDATRSGATAVLSSCPSLRNELRRGGATWLGPDGRWAAVDTQSFHALRSNRWIGCYFREYAMVGHRLDGASPPPASLRYADAPPADFSQQDFWRCAGLCGLGPCGRDAIRWRIPTAWPRGGKRPARGCPRTTISRGPGGASLEFLCRRAWCRMARRNGAAGNPYARTIMASSTAQTYFVRPSPSPDGRDELATLFRPYWQARLAAAGPAEEGQEGRP